MTDGESLLAAVQVSSARVGGGGSREYTQTTFPPPETTVSPRAYRASRRGLLWAESSLERVRKCGRVAVTPVGSVAVRRAADGTPGYAGLSTCSSVWADPVCNAKIMARRALELGAGIARWQASGGSVVFGTFTIRHHLGQSLASCWAAVTKAWHYVTAGSPWLRAKARYGITGWVRVVEVTYGRNGWHVHVHALLFVSAALDAASVDDLRRSMSERWVRAAASVGFSAALDCQDMRVVSGPADGDLAAYFTKAVDAPRAMALEVTQSQSKRARSALSTSPVWSLLDAIAEGDAEALDLWHEWERVSKGKRQFGWSKGLRDMLRLGAEATDEDIATEEVGSSADDLILITAEGWRRLSRVPADIGRLLDVVQAEGLSGARQFLDARAIEYTEIGSE